MRVSYKRLWKLLAERKMTRTELTHQAKITTNAMARMGRGEDVRVETLAKVCMTLDCTMDDIVEVMPDEA